MEQAELGGYLKKNTLKVYKVKMTQELAVKQHSGKLWLLRIRAYIDVFRHIYSSHLAIC